MNLTELMQNLMIKWTAFQAAQMQLSKDQAASAAQDNKAANSKAQAAQDDNDAQLLRNGLWTAQWSNDGYWAKASREYHEASAAVNTYLATVGTGTSGLGAIT